MFAVLDVGIGTTYITHCISEKAAILRPSLIKLQQL